MSSLIRFALLLSHLSFTARAANNIRDFNEINVNVTSFACIGFDGAAIPSTLPNCCNGMRPVANPGCPTAISAHVDEELADRGGGNLAAMRANLLNAQQLMGPTATATVSGNTGDMEADLVSRSNDLGNASAATTETAPQASIPTGSKNGDPLDKHIQGTRSSGGSSNGGSSDSGSGSSSSGNGTPSVGGTGASGSGKSGAGGANSAASDGGGGYSGGAGGGRGNGSGGGDGGGFNLGSLFGGGAQNGAADAANAAELKFGKGPAGDPLPTRLSVDPEDYFSRIPKSKSIFVEVSERYASWWVRIQKQKLSK